MKIPPDSSLIKWLIEEESGGILLFCDGKKRKKRTNIHEKVECCKKMCVFEKIFLTGVYSAIISY
jgi:hypothetical protein